MRALVKAKPEAGIWLERTRKPEIGHNDVLIKVKRTAICGTDMHIYNWDAWAQKTIPVPMVVGHEFVGEIVEVGSNVNDFRPGQVVSGEGHVVCGRCRNCMAGRRHLCAHTSGIGVNRPGAFAEYISLPMSNVWVHRPGIDLGLALAAHQLGDEDARTAHLLAELENPGQDARQVLDLARQLLDANLSEQAITLLSPLVEGMDDLLVNDDASLAEAHRLIHWLAHRNDETPAPTQARQTNGEPPSFTDWCAAHLVPDPNVRIQCTELHNAYNATQPERTGPGRSARWSLSDNRWAQRAADAGLVKKRFTNGWAYIGVRYEKGGVA